MRRRKSSWVAAALDLSNLRKGIAEQLAGQIEHELRDLQMERTQFRVQVEQILDERGILVEGNKVRYFGKESIRLSF